MTRSIYIKQIAVICFLRKNFKKLKRMEFDGETPPLSPQDISPIRNSAVLLDQPKSQCFQPIQADKPIGKKMVSKEQWPSSTPPNSSCSSHREHRSDKGKTLIRHSSYPHSCSPKHQEKKLPNKGNCRQSVPNSTRSNSQENHLKKSSNRKDRLSSVKNEPLSHFTEKWVYCCPSCNYWSCSSSTFGKHLVSHNSANTFQCTGCNKKFLYKASVSNHISKCRNKSNAKISFIAPISTEDDYVPYCKPAMVSKVAKEGFLPNSKEMPLIDIFSEDEHTVIVLSSDDEVETSPCLSAEVADEDTRIGNLIRYMYDELQSPNGKRESSNVRESNEEPKVKKKRKSSPMVAPKNPPAAPSVPIIPASKPKFTPEPRAEEDDCKENALKERLSNIHQKIRDNFKLMNSGESSNHIPGLQNQIDAKRSHLQQTEVEHKVHVEANSVLRENARRSLRRRFQHLQHRKTQAELDLRTVQWDLVELGVAKGVGQSLTTKELETLKQGEVSIKKLEAEVDKINKAILKVEEEDKALDVELKQADLKMARTAEQLKTDWAQLATMEAELNSHSSRIKEVKAETASMIRSYSACQKELASLSVLKRQDRLKKTDRDISRALLHLKMNNWSSGNEPKPSTSRQFD